MDAKETELEFFPLAESLPQLVWAMTPLGHADYFNRRWYDFTGMSLEQSTGRGWTKAVHPSDLTLIDGRWKEAMRTGEAFDAEYRLLNREGRYCWFLGRALPIHDPSHEIVRWFATGTDINAQKMAEDALRRLDEQHRIALEAAGLGTWDYDPATEIVTWDERACSLAGIVPNGLRSMPFADMLAHIHPEDREQLKAYSQTVLSPQSDGRYMAEYRIVLDGGCVRWIRSNGQVLFEGKGSERRAVRVSGVSSDVTERRATKEAHQILTSELNHRVKNLFAIASGLVSMTARTAKNTQEMASSLRGRLNALSRAHELARPAPIGADQSTDSSTGLERLVETIVAPYRQESAGRIVIEGPPVPLGANAVTSLALVLHELTTNAAKYGCLSDGNGKLTVRWSRKDDAVDFSWIESGGPIIPGSPSFEGFGSILAQRTIAGQLGGTLTRDWQPGGLTVEIRLPIERLAL